MPHKWLCKDIAGRPRLPLNNAKMLAGREANHSGRSRFSSADRCHMLSKYLPFSVTLILDDTSRRVYVSQFSAGGSLFVAAFQTYIKVYDVDNEWKIRKEFSTQKTILAITDTSLSPDQRFLVYSNMTPAVYIIDMANFTTKDGLMLDLSDNGGYPFHVFSVKFSPDG
ncbi:LEC14B protein putative isoform 5 [Tripterygium wilfordii]|uniref:LEC14B protein putative isoform 5 n=1 Tax=Tripterygium wilfordii TaxID=458696 RepID=A0A7J7DHW6_TRIWF|nr:LEC14B protein putative isoform 5 [Tripterygium wilfordii]